MSMDFNSSDFKSSPGSMAWLRDSADKNSGTPTLKTSLTKMRTGLAMMAIVVGAGSLTGMMLLGPSKARSQSETSQSEPVRSIPLTAAPLTVAENAALFNPEVTPTALAAAPQAPGDAAPSQTSTADTSPTEASPADGLSISSQSWRRGGLGSNAQVTFTLRNNNDYAVRDVEIACAFTKRDGSHLTDRTHTINDVISTKSKKTFVRMHVGFVNVFANKAKCSPVSADKI